jgi:hypothetical protein
MRLNSYSLIRMVDPMLNININLINILYGLASVCPNITYIFIIIIID